MRVRRPARTSRPPSRLDNEQTTKHTAGFAKHDPTLSSGFENVQPRAPEYGCAVALAAEPERRALQLDTGESELVTWEHVLQRIDERRS